MSRWLKLFDGIDRKKIAISRKVRKGRKETHFSTPTLRPLRTLREPILYTLYLTAIFLWSIFDGSLDVDHQTISTIKKSPIYFRPTTLLP